ncbi:uncharacterized protein [Bemisia tabaci]|uniref:uncharacterized protein isoform X2 n=1 Tax=Bemisia tabaci TaxID=7038 RepID=UPI003B283223
MVYPHYDVSSAATWGTCGGASSSTSDSGGGDMKGCGGGGGGGGGGSSMSGSGGGGSVRSVRLSKRHGFGAAQPSLGFSIRGGHEHGTGFFISAVENGSEAHSQGLKVGDQIIRVNGFPVEDATHRELLQLIQNQTTVNLKVRSVGMIPVKDSYSESLTWRLVEPSPGMYLQNHSEAFNHVGSHNYPRSHGNVVVTMDVPPKGTLGCGICKGPDWKPGIFVQFTKENGLARDAGLRPGDQILQCNNVDFTNNVTFNEAVSVLRGSGRLVLLVKKGAGAELFPGESSGYNSSASSVAGDQSPETWVNKSRLSHQDSDHRLISDQFINDSNKERHLKPYESNCNGDVEKTVIHVSSSDVIPSQRDKSVDFKSASNKLTEICMVSQQMETTTTTVLVEVHQNNEDAEKNKRNQNNKYLDKSSSGSSFSGSSMTSLSSAISQEIQRRSERKASDPASVDQPPQKGGKLEKLRSNFDKEKVIQHEQLMQEFKRAHRRMFSPPGSQDSQTSTNVTSSSTQAKVERNRGKEESKGAYHYYENGTSVNGGSTGSCGSTTAESSAESRTDSRLPTQPPPPPPPLPSETSSGSSKEFSISETIPSTHHIIGPPTPPDCPTPDYDSLSIVSTKEEARRRSHVHAAPPTAPKTAKLHNGKNSDLVEMQSIESFKLTSPATVRPKPPPTYFVPTVKIVPNSNNSSVSPRSSSNLNGKPAVTIREYPSAAPKKQPSRMEFLPKSGETVTDFPPGTEPTSRLQTELCQTLARSNLNKRFLKHEVSDPEIGNGSTSSFVNGNKVTISINPQQPKSTFDSTPNCKSNQNPFYLFPHKNKCLKTEELSDRFCNVNGTSNIHNGHSNFFVLDKSALKNGQANLRMNSKNSCDSNKNSVTFNFNSKRTGDLKSGSDSRGSNGLCSILKNGNATGTTNVSKVQIKN